MTLLAAFDVLPHTQGDLVRLPEKENCNAFFTKEIRKPGRVRQTLPLLPKLLSNCPDQVWLEAATAPNVPGKKLKVTILKPW